MLRIISDVHGHREAYLEIIEGSEYSLQIGDLGFDYDFLIDDDNFVSLNHRFFVGNHDDHSKKYSYPHCYRKYGLKELGGVEFFFLEGGFSIDQKYRREQEELQIWPKTWWENEELSQEDLEDAIKLYKELQPDVLISHEPGRTIADMLGNPSMLRNWGYDPETFTTRTGEVLERMINAHAPKLHIFGHFHQNFDEVIKGTRYICQEELGYLDLSYNLNVTKYSHKADISYE